MKINGVEIKIATLEELDNKPNIKIWYDHKNDMAYYWSQKDDLEHEEAAIDFMERLYDEEPHEFALDFLMQNDWIRIYSGGGSFIRSAFIQSECLECSKSIYILDKLLKRWSPNGNAVYVQANNICQTLEKTDILNGLPSSFRLCHT